MSVQTIKGNAVDLDGSWMYRVGGLSALAFGIAYIIIIALYVPMGAPPGGAEARLMYVAANTTTWWGIIGLSVLTDFLLVPVAFALYFALQGVNRSAMLLAVTFMGLFVVLDLSVTWTNYVVLTTLGENYTAAANDMQRAALVAAAAYPSAVLESGLLFVYNTLTLSIGILMTGLVMLRGRLGKSAAYLGVLTGIVGCAAVASSFVPGPWSLTIILASALTTVWVLVVGFRLLRIPLK